MKDITVWASDEIRTIEVVSDICPVPLKLAVRKFVPREGDSQHRGWMDGKVKRFFKTTPWAIPNISTAKEVMKKYIENERNIHHCLNHFLGKEGRDELVLETYDFAWKYKSRESVVCSFLFLTTLVALSLANVARVEARRRETALEGLFPSVVCHSPHSYS